MKIYTNGTDFFICRNDDDKCGLQMCFQTNGWCYCKQSSYGKDFYESSEITLLLRSGKTFNQLEGQMRKHKV